MKHFITLAFTALLSISALAQTKIDGIYYNLDDEARTATVTYKLGDEYKGEIVIPGSVLAGNHYVVTEIGESAFNYCKNLTSVTLPSTITTIGSDAFNLATSLTKIEIPASVENFGAHIFNGSGITEISLFATVPPTVGNKTFQNFSSNGVTVYVPENCVKVYEDDANWGQFDIEWNQEISYLIPSCLQDIVATEEIYDYSFNDGNLVLSGLIEVVCGGLTYTAKLYDEGDTIKIETIERGSEATSCLCFSNFKITIPNFNRDSCIVLFRNQIIPVYKNKTDISPIDDNSVRIWQSVTQEVFVEVDDCVLGQYNYALYTSQGQLVRRENILSSTTQIILPNTNNVYFVKVYKKGKQSVASKVVKNN
ncbi:MAG: leucine-rich repeat domain-containing protein [Bacteroidales bacterium]|nr:leucine-rich repeat domain-containing protein [Bacteroidales bacterium]